MKLEVANQRLRIKQTKCRELPWRNHVDALTPILFAQTSFRENIACQYTEQTVAQNKGHSCLWILAVYFRGYFCYFVTFGFVSVWSFCLLVRFCFF